MKRDVIIRALRAVGFLMVVVWAVSQTFTANNERGQKDDLIAVLTRRSPVTDYQAAEFGHDDCRKNYEDAYLAAVGSAITSSPGDPAREFAVASVKRYTDILANIEVHCPTPRPPEFDDAGKLLVAPYIPDTTTSTTMPSPPPTLSG